MLKKLFISLIILSALTSEGIMYWNVNAYNFGMLSTKMCTGFQGVRDIQDKSLSVAANISTFYRNTSIGRAFVLTSDSLLKISSNISTANLAWSSNDYGAVNYLPPSMDFREFNLYKYIFTKSFHQNETEAMLKKSDSSPPFAVL
jgi:hypothetical protein